MGSPVVVATTICCLGLFFGLFFGLNYPEIRINTVFKPSICNVLQVDLVPRFCCSKSCYSCSQCSYGAPSCNALVASGNTLDPIQCDLNPSSCPTTGACCDGYQCCRQCCSTCQSCSQSCSGSGSSRTCRQSCSSYPCNCYCCSSVSDQGCSVSCPRCYSLLRQIGYDDVAGNYHVAFQRIDFQRDQGAAVAAYQQYPSNTTLQCWYDPDDFNSLAFQRGYTAWKWVLTAFPMVALLLLLCTCTYAVLADSQGEAAPLYQFALWFGVLFPYAFFMPLWTSSELGQASKNALVCLTTSFTVVGLCPLVVLYPRIDMSPRSRLGLFALFFALPIGILLPVRAVASGLSDSTNLSLTGACIALPLIGMALVFFRRCRPDTSAHPSSSESHASKPLLHNEHLPPIINSSASPIAQMGQGGPGGPGGYGAVVRTASVEPGTIAGLAQPSAPPMVLPPSYQDSTSSTGTGTDAPPPF